MQLVGNCILEMEAGGKAFLRAARVFHEPSLPRCTVSRHFNLSPGLKVLADTVLRQRLNQVSLGHRVCERSDMTWNGLWQPEGQGQVSDLFLKNSRAVPCMRKSIRLALALAHATS